MNKLISSDTPAFETIRMQVRFQETTDDVIKNTKFLAQNHRFKSEKLVEELLQKGGEAEGTCKLAHQRCLPFQSLVTLLFSFFMKRTYWITMQKLLKKKL